MSVAGDDPDRGALRSRLAVRLSTLDAAIGVDDLDALHIADVVLERAGSPERVRVWVDLGDARGVAVYVSDQPGDRVLARTVPWSGRLDEVATEQIVQIVFASVEAILGGATVGVTRAEASVALGVPPPVVSPMEPEPDDPPRAAEATPEPRRPDPERRVAEAPARVAPASRWLVTVAAGYFAQPWARRRPPLHGPQLRAGAAWRGPLLVGAHAVVRGRLPQRVDVGALRASVSGATFLAGGSLGGWVSPDVSLSAGVAGGVLLTVVSTEGTGLGARPRPREVRSLPALQAGAGPTLWLGRRNDRVVVQLQAGVVVDPVAVALTADDGAVRFAPWRVRPHLALSVGWGKKK
ncbi:MAG: hypothetical protein AAF721_19760 [Myxococcota bacterium]